LKLGSYRCYTVENRYKDANELLYREGKDEVRKVIEIANPVPIIGLIDLADVKPLDVQNIQKVSTGIPALDREVGGTTLGTVTVLSGKRGEGKSTIAGIFLLEAVDSGYPVCAYSGELAAEHFQYWINLQAAGKNNVSKWFDQMRGIDVSYLCKEKQKQIQSWYHGKFFLYDNRIAYNSTTSEDASILKVFEYAAKRYDCKVFMIDNLMSARKEYETSNDFYRAQGNFVGKLTAFSKAFNVAVYLIAHPRKTKGGISNDDVSGSSEITDRADNSYVISRDENGGGKLTINKNRGDGNIDIAIYLSYCNTSRRLYQKSIGDIKRYGWDKTPKEKDWMQDAVEATTEFPWEEGEK
jgi:twinkle protein